jgi:catalase
MTPTEKDAPLAARSQEILKAFDDLNGLHPGFRPAHAKGMLFSGVFTPAPTATLLTRAPHLSRPSTPVTVRLADSTAIPTIPDNDPNAGPRGIAIRFHLGADTQTDIVAHSVDRFPARNAEEFLQFLHAARASGPDAAHPTAIETFLGAHPAALAFIQAAKPFPSSFAREFFFAINAFKFTNQSGAVQYGRYRIRPDEGTDYLTPEAAAAKSADYLFAEIKERVAKGGAKFHIAVQVAASGDVTDDATVKWPEDRPQTQFGTLQLTGLIANNPEAQRLIIFDPVPRVDGIEASDDPLLELRSSVYLLSGRRRAGAK